MMLAMADLAQPCLTPSLDLRIGSKIGGSVLPIRSSSIVPCPKSTDGIRGVCNRVVAEPLFAGLALGALRTVRCRCSARRPRFRAAAGSSSAATTGTAAGGVEPNTACTTVPAQGPFACPVCQGHIAAPGAEGAACQSCRLSFPHEVAGNFTDLTVTAAQPFTSGLPAVSTTLSAEPRGGLLQRLPFVAATDAIAQAVGLPQSGEIEALGRELLRDPQQWLGRPSKPAGTATFQNPLVSFAYERGWRRSFASSGFPGVDKEFDLAQAFLAEGEGLEQDTLLDASCGSGLFSRRFAASGKYRVVVALDYSATMLRQVDDFARQEFGPDYSTPEPGRAGLVLVRGDIARLPLASGTLGGVHAGAAIHCWPAPENAVAEIARVLRPGGVFVLTTFRPRGPLYADGANGAYRFWEEEELRTLTRQCGLVDFQSIKRQPAFIMVRVRKPDLS
mmetsp:Transcript_136795/g.381329  ORF Transcript_136795/g.381329 Transcript_136795/m.381329 type:complete len:447 (+) Transcript_136795:42-1382(+)|eukprot:CAMPEP_0179074662 /NCGR_PEP_ID=MMETSP0796-20121207/33199_1 /TAXON_ID=73915 /ORGANISM="Pyrodinium bahamense, Strain pbaha01" /LENGTH=446 /DNA_ID=CAMNT_0020771887 /DNA_START=34 /DNA_END=1374 /DNA_ORIENTATION=-